MSLILKRESINGCRKYMTYNVFSNILESIYSLPLKGTSKMQSSFLCHKLELAQYLVKQNEVVQANVYNEQ